MVACNYKATIHVGDEHWSETNREKLIVRRRETGEKMGKDKVRETTRAFSIDFVSAAPPSTGYLSEITEATGTLPSYVISAVITALITVRPDLNCAR